MEIAPSTYYSAKTRPLSARAISDAALMPILLALWVRNYSVYGRRKLTKAARKAGHDVGRDQVARLMRQLNIRGATRAVKRFTTHADPAAVRAPDLVGRDFTATRPNEKWVADFTYCSTWSGIVYVAFVHGHEKVLAGGQVRSPLVATRSPRWWPAEVPAPR